jgi:acyl-CoA synthetase (NDP forming)
VAIVGNAGGPLILAADAAEASSLSVPELSTELQSRIRRIVPDAAATANPVDLLATVNTDQMNSVIDAIAGSGEFDALVVVTVPVAGPALEHSLAQHRNIPVLTVRMGAQGQERIAGGFPAPERALYALARVAHYADWRRRQIESEPGDTVSSTPTEVVAAAVELDHAVCDADGWVQPADAFHLLSTLGVGVPRSTTIRTADELNGATEQIGLPVVMKATATGVVHKTEAGAVAVDVRSVEDAASVFRRFQANFADQLQHVLVQQYCASGIELIVGVSRSERYGPLLVVGAGGIAAEVLADSVVLLAPATETEVREALERLRIAPLLRGYRAIAAVDLGAAVRCVVRIGQLAELCPQISEMDINPLIASSSGVVAVDVRIRVSDGADGARPLRGLRPAAVR